MSNNTQWGSRLGFILASAGSAIGLGAIWKFPFWAGANGGGAFIIPYVLFTFTIGVALVAGEIAIGRHGRGSAVSALRKTGGKYFAVLGGFSVLKEFGPLIVSIDTHGHNLFEENKVIFNERKDKVYEEIAKQVGFIK